MGLAFYMSAGSKYQQAKVVRPTLPPLVLGTFKLWLSAFTNAVSVLQVLTNIFSLPSLYHCSLQSTVVLQKNQLAK